MSYSIAIKTHKFKIYIKPEVPTVFVFYTTGKDRIIFVTKEDHATPSSAELTEEDPDDPYEEQGEELKLHLAK